MPTIKLRKPLDARARSKSSATLHDWTELFTDKERRADVAGLPDAQTPPRAVPKRPYKETAHFPVIVPTNVVGLRDRLNFIHASKNAAIRARERDWQSSPDVGLRPKSAPYVPKPEPETVKPHDPIAIMRDISREALVRAANHSDWLADQHAELAAARRAKAALID